MVGPRVRAREREERPKVPQVHTRGKTSKIGLSGFVSRNRRQGRKLRGLRWHVPLTSTETMFGILTDGIVVRVLMNGMTTGVRLDSTKVRNGRMTRPQAHFSRRGLDVSLGTMSSPEAVWMDENELGHRSCSEHIPIESWSRRSKRWKSRSCTWWVDS